MMNNHNLQQIKELFPCQTDSCRRNVDALVKDSIQQLGVQLTFEKIDQWKILSKKLNNKSKLTCLGDKNHRLMLLQFVKAEAALQYKSSYFNRAKIRQEYIEYLKKIGPYVFSEVITIVNKLKLIKKHHFQTTSDLICEDHISMKIRQILSFGDSKKRTENSSILKFIKIVEFEDREGLTKELGKMLRTAWTKQKGTGTHHSSPEQMEHVKTCHLNGIKATRSDELEFIDSNNMQQFAQVRKDQQDWI